MAFTKGFRTSPYFTPIFDSFKEQISKSSVHSNKIAEFM